MWGDEEVPNTQCRGIAAYFDDPRDLQFYAFQWMDGTVIEELNEQVTHVFIDAENIGKAVDLYKRANEKRAKPYKIINSSWIASCFKNKSRQPIEPFIL